MGSALTNSEQRAAMKLPMVTRRATSVIGKLMKRVPEALADQEMIPIVTWIFDSSDATVIPGPQIGLQKSADVPREYITSIHGLELAFGLPEELMAQYEDYALDYLENKFVFVQNEKSSL
jgi:hypothetical protein